MFKTSKNRYISQKLCKHFNIKNCLKNVDNVQKYFFQHSLFKRLMLKTKILFKIIENL